MFTTFFVGTAGSGKSTLTQFMSQWLKVAELHVITVNLDPGVRRIPYSPDVDVRDYVTVDDLMADYSLGPNGALIAAIDLLAAENIDDIREEISEFKPEWVLVDTPGQMEIFAYRNSGFFITSAILKSNLSEETPEGAIVYLIDPVLSKRPSGFISLLFLAASVQYRFLNVHQVNILSKSDLLSDEELERILEWSQDEFSLIDALEKTERGERRELSETLSHLFKELGVSFLEMIPVSCLGKGIGLENLYAMLQRIFAGGEDYLTFL